MLTLFRGDDLAFAEYDRKVCVRFNTCLDLTGWAAKFCLFDNVKMTADISSRIWTFGYTAEETQIFPLGKTFGKLLVIDPCGQIRQMSKVEVEVVNQKLEPAIAGFIAIAVDNIIADYKNMGNKPVLNGKTIEGSHDSEYYGLASKEAVEALEPLPAEVQNLSNEVAAQSAALAETNTQLQALSERVDQIPDYESEITALGHRISEETTHRGNADADLSRRIYAETQARETAISNVATSIATETQAREGAIASAMAAIEEERNARQDAIAAIADGTTPISSLLFTADGDTENYYRIQVVMRDDGGGGMQPVLALDAVPREESSDA